MFEDKLTRDERLRLEALAQSVASMYGRDRPPEDIINRAKKFEIYISGEEK